MNQPGLRQQNRKALPRNHPLHRTICSLSGEAAEEDEDSAARSKERSKDPTIQRIEDEWLRKVVPKELPCLIRDHFRDGSWQTPQETLQSLKRALICRRLTPLLKKTLKSGLNAAVRRRILQRHRGGYQIATLRFADYDDAFLETHLLRVIRRTWIERSEVPTLLARHLGFKKTTPAIKDTTRRLIKRLVRNGWLETSGREWIRCT
jgi:hypothetical protein